MHDMCDSMWGAMVVLQSLSCSLSLSLAPFINTCTLHALVAVFWFLESSPPQHGLEYDHRKESP